MPLRSSSLRGKVKPIDSLNSECYSGVSAWCSECTDDIRRKPPVIVRCLFKVGVSCLCEQKEERERECYLQLTSCVVGVQRGGKGGKYEKADKIFSC